jgi:serine/threonine-protein kinase
MAVVYRAEDLTLGRTVAVKILREALGADPELLERFKREARAAARLNHPNIVAIYDVGLDDHPCYMVMEYVEGTDLRDVIREQGSLPPEKVVDIGCQIAAALEYAHRNGLVHRDIKSQNVLVTPQGKVKVADFGIAVTLGERSITQTGMVIGSVHYMAPEQAEGRPITAASDVYALGVVLYEMATGQLPFNAETPVAIARLQLEAQPTPPQVVNPLVPTPIAQVILACLEKDPEARPASAALVAAALRGQRALAAQPTAQFPAVNGTERTRDLPGRANGKTGRRNAAGARGRPIDAPQDAPAPLPDSYFPTEVLPAGRELSRRSVRPVRRSSGSRFWGLFWLTVVLAILGAAGGWLIAGRDQLVGPRPTAAPVVTATPPPVVTQPPAATKPAAQPTAPPATATPQPATATPPAPSATPVPPTLAPPTPAPPTAKPTAPPVPMAAVPNVVNKSEADAAKILEGAGFTVSVEERRSLNAREGIVVEQAPAAGTSFRAGSPVTIFVGRGLIPPKPAPKPGSVLVPGVEGMSEKEARKFLEDRGFKVQVEHEEARGHKGVVINQNPEKDNTVPPGTRVTITIGD